MATTRPVPSRRFTLGDGMILVAATAGAGPGLRWIAAELVGPVALPDALLGLLRRGQFGMFGAALVVLAVPIAVAWTVALIPLRLRRPRPSWRRLGRQPGWVAACSAAAVMAVLILVIGAYIPRWGPSSYDFDSIELSLFTLVPVLAGVAVLGGWLALIVGGRWRPERSWVDRLGRALGVYWLAMAAAGPFLARWLYS